MIVAEPNEPPLSMDSNRLDTPEAGSVVVTVCDALENPIKPLDAAVENITLVVDKFPM